LLTATGWGGSRLPIIGLVTRSPLQRQVMKRKLISVAAAVIALAASFVVYNQTAYAATGLHVSGRNVLEANGSNFIMRGINHAHIWYTGQTQAFADIKATGANTVRVVLGSGKRWGPSEDIPNIISLCKTNKLICILEVHDTTGYGEDSAAATLDEAADYWISQKANLVGQEAYVAINIGNEPIGNTNPAQWTDATVAAIKKLRTNGFEHMLVVDAPNWGQDWQNVMRDNAQAVYDADTLKNTLLSIHMYSVYASAATITSYLDVFQNNNWPLIIGEFGWQFASTEVDDQTVIAEAQKRGLGYIAWSWSGNTDPILDLVLNFDPAQTTTWYDRVVNGTNGIKATSKEATIFGGGGTSTTSPTTAPTTTPATTPTTTPTTAPTTVPTTAPTTAPSGKACSATYSVTGQWSGGFQGDVKVTAGSAAITGWTVTWTYANGQTVSNSWGATVTSSGTSVTAKNVSYNGSVSAGAATSFGFLGTWNGTNGVPTLSCTAS
jgi:mannan endo-1,4-beta-mannosidase